MLHSDIPLSTVDRPDDKLPSDRLDFDAALDDCSELRGWNAGRVVPDAARP